MCDVFIVCKVCPCLTLLLPSPPQAEFRSHRALQEPQQVQQKIALAQQGLGQLQMYSGMQRNSEGAWEITLNGGNSNTGGGSSSAAH